VRRRLARRCNRGPDHQALLGRSSTPVKGRSRPQTGARPEARDTRNVQPIAANPDSRVVVRISIECTARSATNSCRVRLAWAGATRAPEAKPSRRQPAASCRAATTSPSASEGCMGLLFVEKGPTPPAFRRRAEDSRTVDLVPTNGRTGALLERRATSAAVRPVSSRLECRRFRGIPEGFRRKTVARR